MCVITSLNNACFKKLDSKQVAKAGKEKHTKTKAIMNLFIIL